MASYVPVAVHKASFAFCRYSMAAVSWLALALRSRELVIAGGAIMLLSALLKVRRAPLVSFWDATFERLKPSPVEILDENSMRFAHMFGFALFAFDTVLLSFQATLLTGWIFLGFISVAKTAGALGFCGASKMYSCATNSRGNCCSFWRRIKS